MRLRDVPFVPGASGWCPYLDLVALSSETSVCIYRGSGKLVRHLKLPSGSTAKRISWTLTGDFLTIVTSQGNLVHYSLKDGKEHQGEPLNATLFSWSETHLVLESEETAHLFNTKRTPLDSQIALLCTEKSVGLRVYGEQLSLQPVPLETVDCGLLSVARGIALLAGSLKGTFSVYVYRLNQQLLATVARAIRVEHLLKMISRAASTLDGVNESVYLRTIEFLSSSMDGTKRKDPQAAVLNLILTGMADSQTREWIEEANVGMFMSWYKAVSGMYRNAKHAVLDTLIPASQQVLAHFGESRNHAILFAGMTQNQLNDLQNAANGLMVHVFETSSAVQQTSTLFEAFAGALKDEFSVYLDKKIDLQVNGDIFDAVEYVEKVLTAPQTNQVSASVGHVADSFSVYHNGAKQSTTELFEEPLRYEMPAPVKELVLNQDSFYALCESNKTTCVKAADGNVTLLYESEQASFASDTLCQLDRNTCTIRGLHSEWSRQQQLESGHIFARKEGDTVELCVVRPEAKEFEFVVVS